MSRATYPLKLPTSIKTAAARLAKEDGVSLNQWIAAAVAQKVGAVETAAEFFRRRAAGHGLDELGEFLAGVPHRAPDAGDELPES
jgi:HicB family